MNVLITSVSKKVSLVKSFKEAFNGIGLIYGTDISNNAPALHFCDKGYSTVETDSPSYFNCLFEFCKYNNIKLIVPTRDDELLLFAENIERFATIDCKILVSSKETIKICLNKLKFHDFCVRHNIPTPIVYNCDDHQLPCIIKPTYGSGGKNISVCNADLEVKAALFDNFDVVIQEYLPWTEYTVDIFSDFDGNIISVVPRIREKVSGGESIVSVTDNNPVVIGWSLILAKQLNLIGHCNIQCLVKDNVVKFIEVNPRFGGASVLSFEAGANSPKFLAAILQGYLLEPRIGNFESGLRMLRYTKDMFISKDKDKKHIYCIDIDGTICSDADQYIDAKPNQQVIDKINRLYKKGNGIVLYTARGAASGHDWTELTEKQLEQWGVLYHGLVFGKPFADYYIDNKAINVLDWVDV
jgi:carbamoyl-phosphate synthase large subunit